MIQLRQYLFALLQYLLPHHALSRLMGVLTQCRNRTWKNFFINGVIRLYRVDVAEAVQTDLDAYPSFNDFFTRALKPQARPVAPEKDAIVSPADGTVSQTGEIVEGRIIQAKGKTYTATELLGGDSFRAEPFQGGGFATIYLSPRDYHRLHMPLTGTLREMVHVPGRLFSVNQATTETVPNLFARNERVVAIFDTAAGPMALVLVGAIFVASIETVWNGVVTPPSYSEVRAWRYPSNPPRIEKGMEMGRFNMGSTIVVLFGQDRIRWAEELAPDRQVKMGATIGRVLS